MNRITQKLITTVAAGLLVGGSMVSAPAWADQARPDYQQNRDQNQDRQDRDRDWNQDQNRDWNRDRDWNTGCNDDRDQRTRAEVRCDTRKDWRDTRRDARWDDRQHNGYYGVSGWRYGPPPQNAYGQRNFAPGYNPWQAGDRLGYYKGRYVEVNYRSQNLKKPRRGDHWVRDDRGVYILASISSGLIRQIINRSAR
jgi:Ni/Co efflux regulator RcnB